MVHIVIKTDDTETAVMTRAGEAASATTQGPGAPSEVLATAAAVTAQNAGPAPPGAPTATGAPPPAAAEPGVPGAGTDALAAGAAPGTRLEPPPAVMNEDGE
jgi:hypothetical protein